jgi:tetrathionate reductase subunit A
MTDPDGNGLTRRALLARAGLVGGAAAVAGWGISPWVGDVFHRRGEYVYPNRPPTWSGVETRYSVCKQCGSDCGLAAHVFNGVLQKLDGNPFHPASTEPHAPYATPAAAADVWAAQHSLCARGQAGRQTLYDPYRLTLPLKRTGPRGSGRWQTISWLQLIQEVVTGGYLFRGVAGEEKRNVRGFAALWDGGRGRFRPIDRQNPDLGPQTNGLAFYFGGAEAGQTDFIGRFAAAFGTVNAEPGDAICDLNRMQATMQSLDGSTDPLKPDILNAEYILFFGVNVLEASFPMQALGRKLVAATSSGRLTYHAIDVRTGNSALHAARCPLVKPGGDGALAMGMIRWIIDQGAYDSRFLEHPNQKAAEAGGYPTYSNASWLVISDPQHPNTGQFLTPRQSGLAAMKPSAGATGPAMGSMATSGPSSPADQAVVLDPVSKRPTVAGKAARGALWPHAALDRSAVVVNGIRCRTAFQLLAAEANRFTLEQWANEAGVSADTIRTLALEFTSHGRRAVADFGRGPTMHSNGFYTGRAIMTLNFLIGNIDWAGGYTASGGGADLHGGYTGAPYKLASWTDQPQNVPGGVPLSRSGARYEDSLAYKRAQQAGKSPYPAPRPWFPFGGGQWPELFAGAYQGYPYRCQILVQHMANPAWSCPAIAGTDDAQLPFQRLVRDTEKVPLFIAIDTVISESSALADYIVPDTMYLEGWEFPGVWPIVPTRVQGVRQPVVEPLTGRTASGAPMCMEQFLIDVAVALQLPGFGANAFGQGHLLQVREDYYLKMAANVAYDPSFQGWKGGMLQPLGPVPDAASEELTSIRTLRRRHGRALSTAQWKKVAYVLARGGRFEDYNTAYLPNEDTIARLVELGQQQIELTGIERWAQPPRQIAPRTLRNALRSPLRRVAAASTPPWMTSRYGAAGLPCQIYNQDVAMSRNALTGKAFAGTARYEPPHDMHGRRLDELDPPSRYPFVLATHKETVQSRSYTAADPWLMEMLPEAFIDLSPVDAQHLGLNSGDRIRVHSSTYTQGIVGRLRLLPGMRPGVVAFPHSYGHWQYGSGSWTINGKQITGEPSRNAPVRLNAVMRLDPSLAAPDGWTIGLMDPVTGGQAYFETRVAIEKA